MFDARAVQGVEQQFAGAGRADQARALQQAHVGSFAQRRLGLVRRSAAPDLAAGCMVFVNQQHRLAVARCRFRRGQAGRSGANHQQRRRHGAAFKPVSINMPEPHCAWHARRCGVPSMVTRHS